MGGLSFFAALLLSILVIHSYLYHKVSVDDQLIRKNRETLEIIRGGGGVSTSLPAPPPEYEDRPHPPQPSRPLPPLESPLPTSSSPLPPTPTPSPRPPTPTPSPRPPTPTPSPTPTSSPSPSPSPSPRPPTPTPSPSPSPRPPTPTPSPSPSLSPSPSPSRRPPTPTPSPSPSPRPPTLTPSPSPRPPTPTPSPCPRPTPQPPKPTGFPSTQIRIASKVFKQFLPSVDLDNGDPKGYAKSWQGNDVCHYKGVLCDFHPVSKNKTVAGLDINGAGLSGFVGRPLPLRDFVDQFDDLVFFHANSNNYTGSVPDTSKLQYFYELDVSNNKLTGEFPREVLRAKNLTFLDIRFNSFTGPVLPELFDLDLDVLFINNNQFTQQIPYNLGSSRAHYFTFANNKFTGPIPSSIGKASKTLYEILLLGNKLSGCLPYEIGLLKEATVFDASSNLLTGPIPHSFGCLAKIQFLSLANNQLYGPVPELVCKLSNLIQLSLGNNFFTEIGPECRKLVKKKILDVSKNCILDQPNQKSKAQCANFFSKPRKCPNERLMTFIPCKKYLGSNEKKSAANPVPSAPLSYGTLTPHRH